MRRDPVAGFSAAVLPPESGGPDPSVVARRVRDHLARAPAPVRAAAEAGFRAADVAAVLGTGHHLAELPAARRTAVLDRVAGLHPEAHQALEGLKALALLAWGTGAYAGEIRDRARRHAPARPDPHLEVTPSAAWPSRGRADAVVVGSGAGGAMVARTLARSGLDVVVVEEGRRWSVDELRTLDPLDRYAGLYRDGGLTVALGRPPLVLPIGRGVGGTTLVNSGTCYRTPDRVLRRWRDDHGLGFADPDAFAPHLDEVERTLGVAPVPLEIMGRNGRLLLEGAAALGWSAGPIVRNAPGCDACCQCAIGCPENAKFGVHLGVLPDACRAGARILSEARVERIVHERSRAGGVSARRPDGSTIEITAPLVVVAAGATETPVLLARSGLAHHPELGRNLALHPALGAAGRFGEPVVAWRGVLQSAAVDEFHERDGILVEATATPPGMGSMALPGWGAPLLRTLDSAEHLATVGAMIADAPSGRVRVRAGRAVVSYALAPADAERLRLALERIGELLFAAGALDVTTGVAGRPPARNLAELRAQVRGVDARLLHLAAFHPTGTTRAGADAPRHPVDERGRLRGVEGVWVADASVLPTCPEVNPQVSIMAAALAVADGIVTGSAGGTDGRVGS